MRGSVPSPRPTTTTTIIVSAWEAFVLIEADDPTIGLVAFVPIDMSEGSSCLPTARVRTELAAHRA